MEKIFFAKNFSLNPFSAETFPKLTVLESLISIKPSCSTSNLHRVWQEWTCQYKRHANCKVEILVLCCAVANSNRQNLPKTAKSNNFV